MEENSVPSERGEQGFAFSAIKVEYEVAIITHS